MIRKNRGNAYLQNSIVFELNISMSQIVFEFIFEVISGFQFFKISVHFGKIIALVIQDKFRNLPIHIHDLKLLI